MSEKHWDNFFSTFEPYEIEPDVFIKKLDNSHKEFLKIIGEVKNKKVLEIGCGVGNISVLLAKNGAYVTAVDYSATAIANAKELASYNSVEHLIRFIKIDLERPNHLNEKYDLVVGTYILHHINDFSSFVSFLYNSIDESGKGIFLENNSRNCILMLSRKYLAGRFGIPKYGDDTEHPFEPKEIDMLKKKFRIVNVYYPEFIFFQLMNKYIFKNSFSLGVILSKIDDFVYRYFKFLRKYSYSQIIELVK